jgi:hypothetical protein
VNETEVLRELNQDLGTTLTTPPRCRDEWIAHAVAAGGLPEVRGLWERITGRPP